MGIDRRKWVTQGLSRTGVSALSTTELMPTSSLRSSMIDQNRCLVYGPEVPRQVIGYKRLSLADIQIKIGRGAKGKNVDAAWQSEDVEGKWAATSWGKKLAARKAKASANDFDRFKSMVAHKKKMAAVRAKLKA